MWLPCFTRWPPCVSLSCCSPSRLGGAALLCAAVLYRWVALAEPLLALRMPFWDAWAASNAYDPRFAAEIGERVTAEGVALRVRRMHEGLRLVAQA